MRKWQIFGLCACCRDSKVLFFLKSLLALSLIWQLGRMQFFGGSEISPLPPAPTASGNNAHMMYVFNRNGVCLLYREWNRPLRTLNSQQDHKLMFGLLFSLKSLTAKMDPTRFVFFFQIMNLWRIIFSCMKSWKIYVCWHYSLQCLNRACHIRCCPSVSQIKSLTLVFTLFKKSSNFNLIKSMVKHKICSVAGKMVYWLCSKKEVGLFIWVVP